MSCRRIPATTTSRICLWHKAFSLVRFFDANQRNELGRAADETLLILTFPHAIHETRSAKREMQNAKCKMRRSNAFAFGDFISLIGVKRNEAKKNALCPRHTRLFVDEGIFLQDIHVL